MSAPDYARKYPRTPHLPWSPGMTNDDRVIPESDLKILSDGLDLVVTEKMDGGNITMYRDFYHGRSLDSGVHEWEKPSFALWNRIRWDIPEDFRISVESLFARRSVAYENLDAIVNVINIWQEDVSLSWDDVENWSELLGLPTVPVLYRGNDFDRAISVWSETKNEGSSEGFVIRSAGEFNYSDFGKNVVKWVRKDHIQTDADWRYKKEYPSNGFSIDIWS